jgi:hypothetical protein
MSAFVVAYVAPSTAVANTAVAGSKYAIVFNGTGHENVSYQQVVQGDNPAGSSGQQSGTWTINDNNNGPGVWLPSSRSGAGIGLVQSFQAWHDQFDSSGHAVPISASITESGHLCCDFDPPQLIPYTCSATAVYDNGIGTLVSGLSALGQPYLATRYTNNNRTFLAGHPDPNQPSGASLDGALSCQDGDGSSTGGGNNGGFTYPQPKAGDDIAYGGAIPVTSLGAPKITVPATDQSHITSSADCDPADTMDYTSCTIEFSITGSYTLTKICDGAITYTSTSVTGTCGKPPPPPTTKPAGRLQREGGRSSRSSSPRARERRSRSRASSARTSRS